MYKKNNIPIKDLVKCIKDTNSYNSYVNSGITLNTTYDDFTVSVDEKPTNVFNYTYNNTDISTYCIATWVDSTTGFSSLPSWCTKIRAILIGGGGAGAQGQVSLNIQYNNHENSNINIKQQYNQDNQDFYTGQAGGGGGGGGFVFLNTTSVSQLSVQCGVGGQAECESGTSTTLTINGTTIITANGGAGGIKIPFVDNNETVIDSVVTGTGVGGIAQGGALTGTGQNGAKGTPDQYGSGGLPGGQQYINSSSIKSYGVGGRGTRASIYGSPGIQGSSSAGNDYRYIFADYYGTGSAGYYRIYFLTD